MKAYQTEDYLSSLCFEGFLAHASSNLKKARFFYLSFLRLEPSNSKIWYLLGLVYLQEQSHSDAQFCFEQTSIHLNQNKLTHIEYFSLYERLLNLIYFEEKVNLTHYQSWQDYFNSLHVATQQLLLDFFSDTIHNNNKIH